jgi:hypothetical protein
VVYYWGDQAIVQQISYHRSLEEYGDLRTEQAVRTVKYANDLVLLTEEETMLEGMIDGLHEIGRCNGMEIKVKKGNEILKAAFLSTYCDKIKKQQENVEYFNYLSSTTRCAREIIYRILMEKKTISYKKKALFTSKLDLNLRMKLVNCYT